MQVTGVSVDTVTHGVKSKSPHPLKYHFVEGDTCSRVKNVPTW